jgi:hypothetical protein
MLPWGVIGYGAALSAILAAALVALAVRPRRPVVIATAALAAAGGPVAWNAILNAVHAPGFFTDAPIQKYAEKPDRCVAGHCDPLGLDQSGGVAGRTYYSASCRLIATRIASCRGPSAVAGSFQCSVGYSHTGRPTSSGGSHS